MGFRHFLPLRARVKSAQLNSDSETFLAIGRDDRACLPPNVQEDAVRAMVQNIREALGRHHGATQERKCRPDRALREADETQFKSWHPVRKSGNARYFRVAWTGAVRRGRRNGRIKHTGTRITHGQERFPKLPTRCRGKYWGTYTEPKTQGRATLRADRNRMYRKGGAYEHHWALRQKK